MKKSAVILALVLLAGVPLSAQNVLRNLGNRARNAVENTVGNKVEEGVSNAVGSIFEKKDKDKKDKDKKDKDSKESASNGWTCPECGATGNTGSFCDDCGAKQPSAATVSDNGNAAVGGWACPSCGTEGNTGKFCKECGAKRPEGGAATWTCPECGKTGNTGKFCDDCGAQQSTVASAVTEEVKSDFVRGSVVLFQDDFKNEQVGEFPSKWDIQGNGSAETAVINGQKYLHLTTDYNFVEPLMENMKSYLPDVFTLEWDVFCSKAGDLGASSLELIFDMGKNDRVGLFEFAYRSWNPDYWTQYSYQKPNSEDSVNGSNEYEALKSIIKEGQWNHFAVSFNKRALKVYINNHRIINLPNVQAPERFKFWSNGEYKYIGFTNVLLCAGAKELYERETTNLSEAAKAVEQAIAQSGKFVTNNILFDTGKATIKPESKPELEKVAEYMKANPTVRFEVQGHTDNQGSDAVNDPLSQQRAEAVVKALEGMGVDGFNLRAVGKGSHEPVADNSTDAGRAKNRRVEFIKK